MSAPAPSSNRGPSETRPTPGPRTSRTLLVGAATLFMALVGLWWMFRELDHTGAAKPARVTHATPEPEHTPPPPTSPLPRELARDEISVMAPGADDNSEKEPRHPHPITPTHERNFKQLNRVAQLNSAMDMGDIDELRQVNRKYREEYPEATLYQDGYDLIADCMEKHDPATRAAAEHYWNTQIASNLRRYVRRYCLE